MKMQVTAAEVNQILKTQHWSVARLAWFVGMATTTIYNCRGGKPFWLSGRIADEFTLLLRVPA